MIGDGVLDAEATEPAIGEVELDLAAQRAFRTDGKHVADDEQHPYHQHRIDRRSFGIRIMPRQLGADPGQVERTRNGANLMVVRNDRFEIERIEQLPLIRRSLPVVQRRLIAQMPQALVQ